MAIVARYMVQYNNVTQIHLRVLRRYFWRQNNPSYRACWIHRNVRVVHVQSEHTVVCDHQGAQPGFFECRMGRMCEDCQKMVSTSLRMRVLVEHY